MQWQRYHSCCHICLQLQSTLSRVSLSFTFEACSLLLAGICYSSVFPLLVMTDSSYLSFYNINFFNKFLEPKTCPNTENPFFGVFPLALPMRHSHYNIFNSHFTGFINDGLKCRNHYFTSFQTKSLFRRPLASKEIFKSLPKRNKKAKRNDLWIICTKVM